MRCSKCGAENPDRAKFCVECASVFLRQCASCGAENPPAAKFCLECAKPLTAADPEAPHLAPSANLRVERSDQSTETTLDGERKTVTALFADIKGSMELMEDLDPEEARALVDPALKLMMDAVHHYGGYVAQSTGDGIFALFGAPIAHEDHPQRALYAARRLQDEMRRYSAKLRAVGNPPIEARVGVNTGEVVVRSIATGEGHAEYTPIGHSTGLAARMQAVAPTGSIATTQATRKFCEGYFTFGYLGPTVVKGVSEPVEVYEVTGLGPLRTRLQRSASRGYTKFVGRQREMEAMKQAAELARAGHGQIVAAIGEPGVGKSRLLYEFKAISESGCLVLETFSVSHGKASAYLPIIELLRNYFEIATEDDQRKRREKVGGKVLMLDRSLEDTLPYLFVLLGINEGDENLLAQMDAQIKRRRTLDAIKRIILRESLNQPLLVIFEDLHWIDAETQAFLNLLADGIATGRILLSVNYRPEYRHEWGSKTYYTQLRLDPLGRESAAEMLTALLGDCAELAPLKRLIIERTEGTPFFMEETVQMLLDEGALVRDGTVKLTRPLSELKMPATVQAILASRIDRLPPDVKELLQMLAVIGREFPLSLVRAVINKSDDELNRILNELQLGEFIYEQPAVGDTEYIFKHALTQEVAYKSLLTQRRKLLHERTARAIEALYAQRLEDHYSELARHFINGGNSGKAIEYLQLAGEQASQRSANSEAIKHFNAALELLNTTPDSADRIRRELRVRVAIGPPLIATEGWASAVVERSYARARELCSRLGETPELFPVLQGLWAFYLVQGRLDTALELANELFALAERSHDRSLLLTSHFGLGNTLLWPGKFAEARSHLERSISLFDPQQHSSSFVSSINPIANAWAFLSHILWCIGYPDQAVKAGTAGVALATQLSDPLSLALAQGWVARLRVNRREPQLELSEQNIALVTEHGFSFFLAIQTILRGCSLAQLGHTSEGITQIREGIAAYRATGAGLEVSDWFALLAGVYAREGRFDEGLAAVDESLSEMQKTGARYYEAELHRLRGELKLRKHQDDVQTAERLYREAVEIAERQGAKSWELRATMSLARLLRDTNRRREACSMLADIYGWFTEGFDTADLKDAKALLDDLGA